MQDDTVVWQIINHGFCSFKTKIAKERTFCQNPYNVTGLCLRSACPLANSRYATIREEEGQIYLYMKTIERAHTPVNLWEKIKLPANYAAALEMVDKNLEYFPKYLVHRNKQRLTKIHQMIIRMRKLKLQAKPIIATVNSRDIKREKGKEKRALQAAQLEKAIEVELLERLQAVASDTEIYNYPEVNYNKVVNSAKAKFHQEEGIEEEDVDGEDEDEEEDDEEGEGEYEEEEEEDDEDAGEVQYVEDFNMSDEEGDDMVGDLEDLGDETLTADKMLDMYKSIEAKRQSKRKAAGKDGKGGNNKKGRVEIEYEYEEDEGATAKATARATAFNSGAAAAGGSRGKKSSGSDAQYNF